MTYGLIPIDSVLPSSHPPIRDYQHEQASVNFESRQFWQKFQTKTGLVHINENSGLVIVRA